jgi:hypothetical protein
MAAISYILQSTTAHEANKHHKSPKYDQPPCSHPLRHYSNGEAPCSHIVCDIPTPVLLREWNPGGGEIFRTYPDRTWGPPSLLYNGYRVFPGDKERPGRDADPSPPSPAVVTKEYSYTSTPSTGRTACTGPQCLYRGALYFTPVLQAEYTH